MPNQLRQGILLTLVSLVVFLTGLGSTHLWDDDETYFAEAAREMAERNDLIVPWFNQRLFAHKPPFMYWMMIAGYRLFGVTEFAARIPSVLFGLATVLLVWRMGRILYSERIGYWAGIVLATSLNFAVISRAATSDAELSFFCTLALYLFVRGTATRRSPLAAGAPADLIWRADPRTFDRAFAPSWKVFALIYATMGMAALVKGPIGIILPTSVLGLFLLWIRERRLPTDVSRDSVQNSGSALAQASDASASRSTWLQRTVVSFWQVISPVRIAQAAWELRPLTAIALVLLVAGPWYFAVGWKTDGEFLKGFFGVHHFKRFTNGMDNHGAPAWYYPAVLCVGFFPWIVFLSPTLIQWYRRVRDRNECCPADILCASWCVVWFGFFSLATTKFPHYIVPAYPALALLTAAFLDRWIDVGAIYSKLPRRGAWLTTGIVGIGILVVVPILQQRFLQENGLAGLTGLPLIAAGVAGAYYTERGRIAAGLNALTGCAVAFLVLLFAFAAVEIDRHQNSDLIAKLIRAHVGSERPVIGHFHYYRPGLSYYCREPIESQFAPENAIDFLNQPGPRYLLTSTHEYEVLKPNLPADTEILAELPWFLKQGKGIVVLGRSRTPEETRLVETPSATSIR